jgi:RimJ/RimL family protein N-acetyltransferase
MRRLTQEQLETLRRWFLPERPGPLVGLHVIQTGHGFAWADRWPEPRAVYVATGANGTFAGDAGVIPPEELWDPEVRAEIEFVEAPGGFSALLRAAFPELTTWERVIFELQGKPVFQTPAGTEVRRLKAEDAEAVGRVSEHVRWVCKTWHGTEAAAASGMAWGAFDGRRIVSLALTFFVGDRFEDFGAATEPEYRGRGLSAACCAGLAADIQSRGRTPCWTTTPGNLASVRVAQKLGFRAVREDWLYVVGRS